jgi:hypothetical protein
MSNWHPAANNRQRQADHQAAAVGLPLFYQLHGYPPVGLFQWQCLWYGVVVQAGQFTPYPVTCKIPRSA